MRRLFIGFVALISLAPVLIAVPQLRSQTQQRPPQKGRQQPPRGQRRGFPPAPPVLEAIDTNNDGELSQEELQKAVAALQTLDKDNSGELEPEELRPDFGPGGPFGGGPGGFGPPFGGRGGPGGFGGPGGGNSSAERTPPEKLDFKDGVAAVPDHATYHELSYRGDEVMIDTFLAGLEFVKFTLDQPGTKDQSLYFINTKTHRAHMMFARAAGLPAGRGDGQMKGVLVYRPLLKSPSGNPGLYTFEFEPFDAYAFKMVKTCQDALIEKMPILKGNIGYYPRGERALAQVESDQEVYKSSDVIVYHDDVLNHSDVGYLPLNLGASFGRLRKMELNDRPSPRDIVLYESLPNEMPRVAGIITSVRQTPLSHVNLRAIQDQVPNAFISDATENTAIKPLIGKYVAYQVTVDGYQVREATAAEVEKHFAGIRPPQSQSPERDLSTTEIRSLDELRFGDAKNVGVKAANLATMRTFGFSSGVLPNGFAVPFYLYDEFMKHNDYYDYIRELLNNPQFQRSRDVQVTELKKLRSLIKKGKMPEWMMKALDEVHRSFPAGSSLRCRSSTNNEDLPGFSGAGLYDSYTHKPDEGHFSKSIKQVYASLWNDRAFEEREFYRVDHFATAMGVLVHPNYKGEQANGVAVTDDILYQTQGNYYINTQVGEDLVTNPDEASIPEELLLDWWDSSEVQVMQTSNRAKGSLLSNQQIEQLRDHLGTIHGKFAKLYGKSLSDERFAMEIEFKITADGTLAIKQARPWVYPPTVRSKQAAEEERQR